MVRESLKDRIQVLYHGGVEMHLIAAYLGLDVRDVAETLADSTHTPTDLDPAGGNSQQVAWVYQEGDWGFASGICPLAVLLGDSNVEPELSLSSFGVVGAGGRLAESEVFMPSGATGSWAVGVKVRITNLAGTEQILAQTALLLELGKYAKPTGESLETASATGEDLVIGGEADTFKITSTAGGAFFVETKFSFVEE